MLYIHGMGHFHPENKIDNAFLEDLSIGTDHQWIIERVGIRERRTVLPLEYIRETKNANPTKSSDAAQYTNPQMGARAARVALEKAGLNASDIGMVISGSCSPQYTIPAEACMLAAEMDITAPSMDISSACSSFAAQMHFLNSMKQEALPDYVLVVNVESMTRMIDFADRRNAVLFGDGAAATIVSAKHPSDLQVTFSKMTSDPSGWDKVVIPGGRHFDQVGSAVQSFAIRKTLRTLNDIRPHTNGEREKTYFIGHQANLLMLQAVSERMEIFGDHHLFNVDEYGNTGAVGAPSVLSQNLHRFTDGDSIMLAVVGSGLSWGGLHIQHRSIT